MEIHFHSRKLQTICNSKEETIRRWGAVRAKAVRRRLKQLKAAKLLSVMNSIPGQGFHILKGIRKGELAVDAEYPLRVIFVPSQEGIARAADGHVEPAKISKITVVAITEYDDD
jgi:plasmid maintenance system killer protein